MANPREPTPSFCLSVAWTSISVRTPKPSSLSAAVTWRTASSYGTFSLTANPYSVVDCIVASFGNSPCPAAKTSRSHNQAPGHPGLTVSGHAAVELIGPGSGSRQGGRRPLAGLHHGLEPQRRNRQVVQNAPAVDQGQVDRLPRLHPDLQRANPEVHEVHGDRGGPRDRRLRCPAPAGAHPQASVRHPAPPAAAIRAAPGSRPRTGHAPTAHARNEDRNQNQHRARHSHYVHHRPSSLRPVSTLSVSSYCTRVSWTR